MAQKRKAESQSIPDSTTNLKRQKQDELDEKWWKGNVSPAPVLSQGDPCPIDWSQLSISAVLREAWEMRSPWKPKPDSSFAAIQAKLNEAHGTNHNTETWRKRFIKVNRMIYKNSGIWWERAAIGLEDFVGKAPKGLFASCTRNRRSKNPVVARYHGETFTLSIQDPTDNDWLSERVVSLEAARLASPRFAKAIKRGERSMSIKADPKLVDVFFSTLFPQRRAIFPNNASRLCRNEDGEIIISEVSMNISEGDIIDLYILAAKWKCVWMRDMIIDHWRRTLHKEDMLREEYITGLRHFSDVPAEQTASLLAMEPDRLNALWASNAISDRDTVRVVWLEILGAKGQASLKTVLDRFDEYSLTFLIDWYDHLTPKQRAQVRPRFHEFHGHDDLSFLDDEYEELGTGPLLNGSADEICEAYHNHGRHADCYHNSIHLGETYVEQIERAERPKHHVEMTIRGVPGFLILNHTGQCEAEFRHLPNIFPDWDWERIRAVHCFESIDTTSKYVPIVKNLYPLPQPIYFENGGDGNIAADTRDSLGRYPSHPGYGKQNWAPPAIDFNYPVYRADEEDEEDFDGQHNGESDDDEDDENALAGPANEDEAEEMSDEEARAGPSDRVSTVSKPPRRRRQNVPVSQWREFLVDRAIRNDVIELPLFSKGGYGFEPYGSTLKCWY